MKRIDLRKMRESVEECLRNYPMEIITGVIYFFIKIMTDYNYSISDRPDLSETQAFFPVVFAVTYALNTWVRRKVAAVYYAVPLLMIALFALFYKELHGFIDSMGFGCTLIAVVMLFFACAKNGENRAFSAETLSKAKDLALSVFTGMLFTGVMSAIYGSVEYLFGMVINAYGKTLFFSLYIVMPVLFLTMHGKSSSGPGKFVKVMLNYILHPAILIYAAILYLYAAKIAVEWTLPEGGVAYMVSAFVIASLAGQMLQLVDAKKIYGWYYRNFLWIALVPLALFWTGVAYRVNAYGFTEARVYLVVFGALMTLFVLIVILVYIVMATQFESLKFPFIIMFTIPFAFTGVFLALWMTSTPLSLIALIGAIMLVGIVTKNGIVMVDYMNLLIERGSGVFDAVIAGGKSRLRPVLMTSFTTVLGMLPLAIGTGAGSETWQPMGIAVIGGLTFSTILTLFIVPVLYSILVNRSQRKEQERLARLAAAHQASAH